MFKERKTSEIYFLEWDDDNEEHLAEHGVSAKEVREMLSNRHLTMANPRGKGASRSSE